MVKTIIMIKILVLKFFYFKLWIYLLFRQT